MRPRFGKPFDILVGAKRGGGRGWEALARQHSPADEVDEGGTSRGAENFYFNSAKEGNSEINQGGAP